MLALVAGFFLVSYLLAPGAIYRLAFSFYIPSKRFQRSRTEEIIFSVFAVLLPFLGTWLLLCHTPVGTHPHLHSTPPKSEAYRQVFQSLLSAESIKICHLALVILFRRGSAEWSDSHSVRQLRREEPFEMVL
jgi:hypothetical protein